MSIYVADGVGNGDDDSVSIVGSGIDDCFDGASGSEGEGSAADLQGFSYQSVLRTL